MKVKSTYLPTFMYKRRMPSLDSSLILDTLGNNSLGICAPTSAANILLYLSKAKAQLVSSSFDDTKHTIGSNLVEILTSDMHTTKAGTNIEPFIDGLEKYVKDRRYKIKICWIGYFYQGKRKLKDETDLELIMKKTIGTSNSILWLGEYKYNKKDKTYTRVTGHAVTIAGFNTGLNGFLVHDPAESYSTPRTLLLKRIEGIPIKDISADGPYKIASSRSSTESDKIINILEGAASFEIYR